MKIHINITRRDYWKVNKYAMLHTPVMSALFYVVMIGIPLYILVRALLTRDPSSYVASAVIAALLLGGIFDIIIFFLMKGLILLLPSGRPGTLGEHLIEINESGLRESTAVNDSFHYWKGIYRIVRSNEYIFIFIDRYMAHVIPLRSFAAPPEADAFYNRTLELWHHNKAE